MAAYFFGVGVFGEVIDEGFAIFNGVASNLKLSEMTSYQRVAGGNIPRDGSGGEPRIKIEHIRKSID